MAFFNCVLIDNNRNNHNIFRESGFPSAITDIMIDFLIKMAYGDQNIQIRFLDGITPCPRTKYHNILDRNFTDNKLLEFHGDCMIFRIQEISLNQKLFSFAAEYQR